MEMGLLEKCTESLKGQSLVRVTRVAARCQSSFHFSGVDYVFVFLGEAISVQDANRVGSKASRASPKEEGPV